MVMDDFALFALTGFGNEIVESLVAHGTPPKFIVTRKEAGPFPYYEVKDISRVAAEYDIPVFYGAEGEKEFIAQRPRLLLCATYHRLLAPEVLDAAQLAINVHPSLLPKYRGPNPFYWVLANHETTTGLTAHCITQEMDAGDIYQSEAVAIDPCETQGTLRLKLAQRAGPFVVELLDAIGANTLDRIPQDESQSSSFGKPPQEKELNTLDSLSEIAARARALSPFPGATMEGDRIIEVVEHRPYKTDTERQNTVERRDNLLRLERTDGELVLRLSSC